MMDFATAREKMVDCQIRTNDVTEQRLISAISGVPREKFLPKPIHEMAYTDKSLQIAQGRYLSEPATFAKLAQVANIQLGDIVLVVGSGTGYSAATFAAMASSVIAIEENSELAKSSEKTFEELGLGNVAIVETSLVDGYSKEAPYDVIFVDGAIEIAPGNLLDQLAENGRLVVVEGEGNAAEAVLYSKSEGVISRRVTHNCSGRLLPGFEMAKEFAF